jgi:two-component system LytT family response regulator
MSNSRVIQTLLVDDEAPARSRLRHLLKTEPDFAILGECSNGREAVAAIRSQKPDLVLLDVQMPGLDGFQVCGEIGTEEMPVVVFVTAYDRFALRAFEVHAIDYLLKPIDRERFQKTMDLLRRRFTAQAPPLDSQLLALLSGLKDSQRTTARLAIKVDGRVLLLRTAEISYLESDGNYVRIHSGGGAHLHRDTLSGLEDHLPHDSFLRISRSAIVNLDAVKEFQPLFYGDHVVILRDGTQLTLSRTYRDRLERLLERKG